MGLLFFGIKNSWNLSKRCFVATSFSGSYNFRRNSKTSLGDLHRLGCSVLLALKSCIQEIPPLASTSYFFR